MRSSNNSAAVNLPFAERFTAHVMGFGAAKPLAPSSLSELLKIPPGDLYRVEIARKNLLCSEGLPGAEYVDVEAYLKTLDILASEVEFVTETQRHLQARVRGRIKGIRATLENVVHVQHSPQWLWNPLLPRRNRPDQRCGLVGLKQAHDLRFDRSSASRHVRVDPRSGDRDWSTVGLSHVPRSFSRAPILSLGRCEPRKPGVARNSERGVHRRVR